MESEPALQALFAWGFGLGAKTIPLKGFLTQPKGRPRGVPVAIGMTQLRILTSTGERDNGRVVKLGLLDKKKAKEKGEIFELKGGSIAVGREHWVWSTSDGRCWSEGWNKYGQCGLGRQYVKVPVPIKISTPILQVSAGFKHTLLLSDIGLAFALGSNEHGQLGILEHSSPSLDSPPPIPLSIHPPYFSESKQTREPPYPKDSCENAPKKPSKRPRLNLPPPRAKDSESSGSGIFSNCSNTSNDTSDSGGRRGVHVVSGLSKVREVACGALYSMALTQDGKIYTWGLGLHGNLGHGDRETHRKPKVVSSLLGAPPITRISAGLWHSACLSDTGDVYCFGRNDDGQVGESKCGSIAFVPTLVDFPGINGERPEDVCITDIATGSRHSLALTAQGDLYGWGSNCFGQILPKPGSESKIHTPRRIVLPTNNARLLRVFAGSWGSAAIVGGEFASRSQVSPPTNQASTPGSD